jgi:hypothetical protein
MWSDNAYSLVRRSYKFESSNEARRHDFTADPGSTWKTGFFAGRMFTTAIAHKALKAHQSLRAAPPDKQYYLEDQVAGLGKNFMRGKLRERALGAYEDYLAFFLLRTFADRPREAWDAELGDLVAAISKELSVGSHAAEMKAWTAAQRPRLPALKENILASLARDDKRGKQIFDDYGDFHSPPEEDGAMAKLGRDLDELSKRLDAFAKA